jgi:hypothetical protein
MGGMSVSPDDPMNLPRHRRPPSFNGIGPDPIWRLRLADLGQALAYAADADRPATHGFIEPAGRMPFDDYRVALEATRSAWDLVVP